MRLFKRQYMWMPTAFGWEIIISLIAILLAFIITNIYPFFAVNSPIPSQVLVVEGWLPDYAVEEAWRKSGLTQLAQNAGGASPHHAII